MRRISVIKYFVVFVSLVSGVMFSLPVSAQTVASAATAADQAKIASAVEAGVKAALAARDASDAAAKAKDEADKHRTYGWGAIIGIGLAFVVGVFLMLQMVQGAMIAGVAQSSPGGGIVLLVLVAGVIYCVVRWVA
jgi:hypothetical protein